MRERLIRLAYDVSVMNVENAADFDGMENCLGFARGVKGDPPTGGSPAYLRGHADGVAFRERVMGREAVSA